jgi:hypothetical protein
MRPSANAAAHAQGERAIVLASASGRSRRASEGKKRESQSIIVVW